MGYDSKISEVKNIIKSYLEKGHKNFALYFQPESILSTEAISVLIVCYELISMEKGSLTLNPRNSGANSAF